MREIKFRIWDTKSNRFHDDEKGYISDSEWIGVNELFRQIQPRFVPLQFTGLKDKNGKEIYEGDIVKANSIYKVIWENELASFILEKPTGQQNNFYGLKLEVIGNIYENSELLKKI